MSPALAFTLLTCAGMFMIIVEVFMPGAVLGVVGTFLLLAAAATAFSAFGVGGGLWACLGLLLGGGAVLLLWLKVFPRTRIAKSITLKDHNAGRASPDSSSLLGADGVSLSTLRPAGVARIAGARHDVMAESGWVDEGRAVKVVRVEAGRVVVREVRA